MGVYSAWAAIVLAAAADADFAVVRRHLRSEDYTVSWNAPAAIDPAATLEIGEGYGHGGQFGWLRLRPNHTSVDVLSIRMELNAKAYTSKWPSDDPAVTIRQAQMVPDAYAGLLRKLSLIDAAKLTPARRRSAWMSSQEFWASARLASGNRTFIDSEWAGYHGSLGEPIYAPSQAAVAVVNVATRSLTFEKRTLTDEERRWASEKFTRDWKRHDGREFYWWVRENNFRLIGFVGDKAAYPTLRGILDGDPKVRSVYYAINAATRLTRTDVRGESVTEMDVERVRPKVRELLRDK